MAKLSRPVQYPILDDRARLEDHRRLCLVSCAAVVSFDEYGTSLYQVRATVNGDQTDTSVDNAGAAYVFARAGGTWTQQAYLKPYVTGPFGTPTHNFGRFVAASHDGRDHLRRRRDRLRSS